MFIYNVKLNGNKILKYLVALMLIAICFLIIFICYKIFGNSNMLIVKDVPVQNTITELNSKNYTNVLQSVHNNLDSYLGQKIKFTGYIYRLYDFTDEQFVLARNMIISSDFQSVVVGFLCQYKEAVKLANDTWIEVEGTIKKGNYHGEIPILDISSVKEVEKPLDEFVYPPDDNFISTSSYLF